MATTSLHAATVVLELKYAAAGDHRIGYGRPFLEDMTTAWFIW